MFSLIETPYCNTNPPVTIYALLSNFQISWFTHFFAPPRTAPRIFIFAPPRRFSSSPRPALPRWKKFRPAHSWLAPPILFRSSCYTDGNGPEVFMQCSTKWIRNFDKSKDEYGDWRMTKVPMLTLSYRGVQEYIWKLWLRKSFTTAKFGKQNLWEISWENWEIEKWEKGPKQKGVWR